MAKKDRELLFHRYRDRNDSECIATFDLKSVKQQGDRLIQRSIKPRKPTLPGKLAIEDQIYRLDKGLIRWQRYDQLCEQMGKEQVHQLMRENKGRLAVKDG